MKSWKRSQEKRDAEARSRAAGARPEPGGRRAEQVRRAQPHNRSGAAVASGSRGIPCPRLGRSGQPALWAVRRCDPRGEGASSGGSGTASRGTEGDKCSSPAGDGERRQRFRFRAFQVSPSDARPRLLRVGPSPDTAWKRRTGQGRSLAVGLCSGPAWPLRGRSGPQGGRSERKTSACRR